MSLIFVILLFRVLPRACRERNHWAKQTWWGERKQQTGMNWPESNVNCYYGKKNDCFRNIKNTTQCKEKERINHKTAFNISHTNHSKQPTRHWNAQSWCTRGPTLNEKHDTNEWTHMRERERTGSFGVSILIRSVPQKTEHFTGVSQKMKKK